MECLQLEEDDRRDDWWNVYSWRKMKGGVLGGMST